MNKDIPDEVIYARDLDGTGSAYICSKEDEGAYEYVRTDTRAAPKVRAIKWSGFVGVAGPVGSYSMSENVYSGNISCLLNGAFIGEFKSEEEAMAGCQADYEKRVLSALEGH